jgi:hypothetical protein
MTQETSRKREEGKRGSQLFIASHHPVCVNVASEDDPYEQ